jgi:hypothetical protein
MIRLSVIKDSLPWYGVHPFDRHLKRFQGSDYDVFFVKQQTHEAKDPITSISPLFPQTQSLYYFFISEF